jgi:hypothetical protein
MRVPDRAYTDAELEAAINAITDPERLREAQDVVARSAPALQRVLAGALEEGGWFGAAHDQAVQETIGHSDPAERVRGVKTMLAEETRLGMLVGVAVGFELARELERMPRPPAGTSRPGLEDAPRPPADPTQQED